MSGHRTPDGLTHDKPGTRRNGNNGSRCCGVSQHEVDDQMGAGSTRASLHRRVKSPACRSRNLAGSTGEIDRPRSGGQLDAALATPSRQDGATSTGTHTQPETMGLGPPTIVRLEGALGHGLLLGKYMCERAVLTNTVAVSPPAGAGLEVRTAKTGGEREGLRYAAGSNPVKPRVVNGQT